MPEYATTASGVIWGDAIIPGTAFNPFPSKDGRADVNEMVRLWGRPGLYEVKEVFQESGTVHVLRNIPKNPIEEDVPFESIRPLDKPMSHIIGRFLNSSEKVKS